MRGREPDPWTTRRRTVTAAVVFLVILAAASRRFRRVAFAVAALAVYAWRLVVPVAPCGRCPGVAALPGCAAAVRG